LTGDIHLNTIDAEVFMTTSYSIDIRKESVIQDYRGSNTETNDFFDSRMSKIDRIDNSNTSSHSSSTNHREVSETDAQSFDKVFFEDRRGTTPGGGLYIPEGRGTVGPDIQNVDEGLTDNPSTGFETQTQYYTQTSNASLISNPIGKALDAIGGLFSPPPVHDPMNEYDHVGDRCHQNTNADCDDYENPGCHCDVDPITGEPECCECSDDTNIQSNSRCNHPENIAPRSDGSDRPGGDDDSATANAADPDGSDSPGGDDDSASAGAADPDGSDCPGGDWGP
jgi:hypothetical protein